MNQLQLLVTTHRIPAHDRSDGVIAFGTTFSLASSSAVPLDSSPGLWPWEWPPIKEVIVFAGPWPTGPVWQRVGSVDVRGPAEGRDTVGNDFVQLVERLGKTRRETAPKWIDGWQQPRMRLAPGQERPWPAFVAELSQLPWPYSQALNLSMSFELDKARLPSLLEEAQIIAVPVIEIPGEGGEQDADSSEPAPSAESRWEPVGAAVEDARVRVSFVDTASGGGPVDTLDALTVPEQIGGVRDGDLMKLSSLWVRPADPSLDPWLERLDAGLIRIVDLVPLALENIDPKSFPESELSALREVVISLMRDLIGLGIYPKSEPDWIWTKIEVSEERRDRGVQNLLGRSSDQWLQEVVRPAFRRDDIPPEVRSLTEAAKVLDALDPAVVLPCSQLLVHLAQLHELLSRPEVTRAVYLQQLDDAFGRSGSGNSVEGLIRADDLCHRLRVECSERMRRRFIDELAGPAGTSPRVALRTALEKELEQRFGGGGEDPTLAPRLSHRPPYPGPVPPADRLLGILAPKSVLEQTEQAENRGDDMEDLNRLAEGVTVRVDRLGVDDTDDLQTRVQGIGLLARVTPADHNDHGGWRHLHVAHSRIAGAGNRGIPVLRPSRIGSIRGLRLASMTYDNEAMSVEGPRALMAKRAGFSLEGPRETSVNELQPIEFSYCLNRALGRMPGLVFGREYQLLPYLAASCGALPKALALEDGLPFEPRWPTEDTENGLTIDPHELERHKVDPVRITYHRRSPVGPVRVDAAGGAEEADQGAEKLELPPVPPDVVPRLPELARKGSDSLPLVFLSNHSPARAEWRFSVRPPATDLETWDRWIAADDSPGTRPLRARLRAASILAARRGTFLDRNEDASFDDPAVDPEEARLVVQEIDFVTGGLSSTRPPFEFPWPARPEAAESDPGWKAVQRPRLNVEIRVRTAEDLEKWAANGEDGVLVRLPPGLYRLGLEIDILHTIRFATEVGAARTIRQELFEIEIPDLTTPWEGRTPEALFERLKIDDASASDGHLTFELDLGTGGGGDLPLWKSVVKAELLRQSWSWGGRPLPVGGHPSLRATAPSDDALVEWEAREMGWRSDEEHLAMPMRLIQDPLAPDETHSAFRRRFIASEPLTANGAEDLRAGHHRFAVRVRHRYAGLLDPETGEQRTRESLDPVYGIPWKRAVVPCRWRGQVPVPRVRLVLPLTQAVALDGDPPDLSSSGLLVVFDEPWFAVGGFAEALEAEVVSIPGPGCIGGKDSPSGDPQNLQCSTPQERAQQEIECRTYYQLGPDPIVGRLPFGNPGDRPEDAGLRKGTHEVSFDRRIHGPVGHTFDRVSSGGRFLASSFFVRPPMVTAGGEVLDAGRDWAFVQLRFRRLLRLDTETALTSQWTEGHWAQLLPPFDKVGGEAFSWLDDSVPLHFSREDERRVELRSRTGSKARMKLSARSQALKATDPGDRPFLPVLLLTRGVPDAAGGLLQEAYVDVFLPKGPEWEASTLESIGSLAQSDLRLRVLQVQGTSKALTNLVGDNGDFWSSIFCHEQKCASESSSEKAPFDRLRTRITAISSPLKNLTFEIEGD